jgi:hypothetical protein
VRWLPTGAPKGRFFWADDNGNGRIDAGEYREPPAGTPRSELSYSVYVDEEGGVWETQDRRGVRHLPLRGFTRGGAPLYDFAQEKSYDRPREFIQVERAVYSAKTDTMFLSGSTWNHPSLGDEHWGVCGREVVCYDHWTGPTRKVRCRMPFPEGATNVKAIAVAHEANLLFAAEMETSVVFVYDTRSGRLLGIVEPDAELVGSVGWVDIDAGIRAFTRREGEVLLIVEDSWSQKEMIYRIPPLQGARR